MVQLMLLPAVQGVVVQLMIITTSWQQFRGCGSELMIPHTSLTLCQSNGADRWVAEDHSWDIGVVHLQIGLVAEEPVREPATGGYGDWCEQLITRHVSQCIDILHVSVLKLINCYEPPLVQNDP